MRCATVIQAAIAYTQRILDRSIHNVYTNELHTIYPPNRSISVSEEEKCLIFVFLLPLTTRYPLLSSRFARMYTRAYFRIYVLSTFLATRRKRVEIRKSWKEKRKVWKKRYLYEFSGFFNYLGHVLVYTALLYGAGTCVCTQLRAYTVFFYGYHREWIFIVIFFSSSFNATVSLLSLPCIAFLQHNRYNTPTIHTRVYIPTIFMLQQR